MKKIKILLYCLVLLLCQLSSCRGNQDDIIKPPVEGEEENMKEEPLPLKFDGINPQEREDGFLWEIKVPAEGISFSVLPSEEYKSIAFISKVSVYLGLPGGSGFSDMEFNSIVNPIQLTGLGEITYSDSPYSINVKIDKNDGDFMPFQLWVGNNYIFTILDVRPHRELPK